MHRSDHQILGIQCSRGHHVATVYETPDGPVYLSITGSHSHGSKDFIDTGKHGLSRGAEHVDLLAAEAGTDDDLAAWCDCGPRNLSRTELLRLVRSGERLVRVT
jgi:hypothetical protein